VVECATFPCCFLPLRVISISVIVSRRRRRYVSPLTVVVLQLLVQQQQRLSVANDSFSHRYQVSRKHMQTVAPDPIAMEITITSVHESYRTIRPDTHLSDAIRFQI
jgi:hypothetical protein